MLSLLIDCIRAFQPKTDDELDERRFCVFVVFTSIIFTCIY